MEETKKFLKIRSDKIISNMKKRKFDGYYCHTKEEAAKLALSMISKKSTVAFGGSKTLDEIGLLNALRLGDYELLDSENTSNENILDLYMRSANSDTYLLSSNAITMNGELVNIDGLGNRISALIFGPKQVIVIVGMNKVTTDIESAIKRARNLAAPINASRLNRKTPCTKTTVCSDCTSPDTICCNILTTRSSIIPGRIKVILVGETLGY